MWEDPARAQELGRERASLEAVVATIDEMDAGLADNAELLEMAAEEDDEETVAAVEEEIARL